MLMLPSRTLEVRTRITYAVVNKLGKFVSRFKAYDESC